MIRLLSILSIFLPIVFFLVYKERNKEKKLWVVFIYCCLSILVDISWKALNTINKSIEFNIYSFFTFAEYSFAAMFFYFTYKTPAFKKILIGCSALFSLIFPLNIIYYRDLRVDSLTFSAETIFIVIFCILYFYEQINDPNITFVYGTKSFWIVIGFLLYMTVGLFPFITKPFLSHREQRLLAPITFMANILKNILLSVSFRMFPSVGGKSTLRKSI